MQTGRFKTDSTETFVPTYATLRHQIPKGRNLNIQHRNKLKSHRAKFPCNIVSTDYWIIITVLPDRDERKALRFCYTAAGGMTLQPSG